MGSSVTGPVVAVRKTTSRRRSSPFVLVFALCSALFASSCVSLTASEREAVDALTHYGIPLEEEKSQGAAMALNFLPGIGNFYLGQTGYGVMNLLLWPVSILWGMPQAWVDAPKINKKQTVDFYRTMAGKRRIESWFAQRDEAVPDALRYVFGIPSGS